MLVFYFKTLTLREPIRISVFLGANEDEDSQINFSNTKVRVSVTLNTPERPYRLYSLQVFVFME